VSPVLYSDTKTKPAELKVLSTVYGEPAVRVAGLPVPRTLKEYPISLAVGNVSDPDIIVDPPPVEFKFAATPVSKIGCKFVHSVAHT